MVEFPKPFLIGVVHLPALPGSCLHRHSMDEIHSRAVTDGRAFRDAGFDALVIENFGDRPFVLGALPPSSVAAMAVAADHVRRDVQIPIGINALRNDARSALGIASASGASFIRVNVHTGVYATDQGIVEGRAHETLEVRKLLAQEIAIFADVNVKHATPLGESDIVRTARDTAYRGLADGLIVTGSATGEPANADDIRRIRAAVPDRLVLVGSGATAETAASLLAMADGIIVGTAVKIDGRTDNPVDPWRAREFIRSARRP